jgi:hypothetical protein
MISKDGTCGRRRAAIAYEAGFPIDNFLTRVASELAAVRTSRLSCGRPGKREYLRQFGSHLANTGLHNGTNTKNSPDIRRGK